MTSPEPVEGRCNYEIEDGQFCEGYPTTDEDNEPINGRCYEHGGHPDAEVTDTAGPYKHGVDTNRSAYYQDLGPEEQIWVDSVKDSFIGDAPFSEDHTGKTEILRQVVIDLHKIRRANKYIDEEGLAQLQTIDTAENGREIKDYVENILNISVDRLQRSTNKRLKDLGVLNGPDDEAAEGVKSLAEILSETDVEATDGKEGSEEE